MPARPLEHGLEVRRVLDLDGSSVVERRVVYYLDDLARNLVA